jgi:hypothetical protein
VLADGHNIFIVTGAREYREGTVIWGQVTCGIGKVVQEALLASQRHWVEPGKGLLNLLPLLWLFHFHLFPRTVCVVILKAGM